MLSAQDRLEILDLYARYNVLVDSRDHDWVEVFTDDGALEAARSFAGRDELHGFIDSLIERGDDGPVVATRHWNNNILLTDDPADPDRVHGRCDFIRVGRVVDTGQFGVVSLGAYVDTIVRIDGRWRFELRRASSV